MTSIYTNDCEEKQVVGGGDKVVSLRPHLHNLHHPPPSELRVVDIDSVISSTLAIKAYSQNHHILINICELKILV